MGKQTDLPSAARSTGRMLLVTATVLGTAAVVGYVFLLSHRGGENNVQAAVSNLKLSDIPFDGAQAYEYLKQLCDLGPRPSGSPAMAKQQALLVGHFRKLGAKVELQRFRVPHPLDETSVEMANIIVHWQPEQKTRILLCAHYDTRPYPSRDPRNPTGRFVGANDNASGVAILMELGRGLGKLKLHYGIDFLLIDGEEFVFSERDRYFLGAEYFARQYAGHPPSYSYRYGVLLDMVGDKDLQLFQERNSAWWKDTKPLVDEIWNVAHRLGVREFIARPKHELRDDHVPLHELGKIPTIDIIDFDYPAWHTENDTPEQCSALSLAKVGWVLQQWLQEVK